MRQDNHNGVKKPFGKGQAQDTKIPGQFKRVYLLLWKEPKTMLMVASELGIYRANVCRYVGKLRERNCIVEVKKGKCKVSGDWAEYLTTNPLLFPKANQIKLFGDESEI